MKRALALCIALSALLSAAHFTESGRVSLPAGLERLFASRASDSGRAPQPFYSVPAKALAYTVLVIDAEGAPVEGVTVQACDASLCMLLQTDVDGTASFAPDLRYAYEIHILKVPDGYVRSEEIYTMPEEGGTITIVLERTE